LNEKCRYCVALGNSKPGYLKVRAVLSHWDFMNEPPLLRTSEEFSSSQIYLNADGKYACMLNLFPASYIKAVHFRSIIMNLICKFFCF